ncbi:unnamed protein product [Hymenolepis diminuta]|uniref:MBD domain-containing protein n=2 Tax=Hymenolepis diminuta TaxID=6216 RepID=A0A0R3SYA2_HYMDI|nr:unnamed protein product [Hymenolepis diminuta]VUZ56900.1 unnamed protein product [Hymenolepis diminuta]
MMIQKAGFNHQSSPIQKTLSVLPSGWRREEVIRPNGLNTGKNLVFYVSPDGKTYKTLKELQIGLGSKYDLSTFDWRTGKFLATSLKYKVPGNGDQVNHRRSRPYDMDSDWFQRGSAPKFLKVELKSNHESSKRMDKPEAQECLRQLFAERRLFDRCPVDHRDRKTKIEATLPPGVESSGVPGYNKMQLMQNLIVSLYTKPGPISGQERCVEQNPCAMINQNQPFVKSFIVIDEDVRKQQHRVSELRERLQAARKIAAEKQKF